MNAMGRTAWALAGLGVLWLAGTAGGATEVSGTAKEEIATGPARVELVTTSRAGVEVRMLAGRDPASRPRIREVASIPTPPKGLHAAGKAYRITPPPNGAGGRSTSAWVSLPLPDAKLAGDTKRMVYVAHHDGRRWTVHPARIADGRAVAQVRHFSRFTVMIGLLRDVPDRGELSRLRIDPPEVFGIVVAGTPWVTLDVTPCRTARIGEMFSRNVAVEKFRVYVSRPANGRTRPSHRDDAFEPYTDPLSKFIGKKLYLSAGTSGLQMFQVYFDSKQRLNIGPNDTPVSAYYWLLKLAPVFADGSEGPPSEPIPVYVGPAIAHAMMHSRLLERLTGSQAKCYEKLSESHYLFFDKWFVSEVYSPTPSSLRGMLNQSLYTRQVGACIGLDSRKSEYDRVITHEWGHHVARTLYGPAAFAKLEGGSHRGWAEASTRRLAWGEDLATFFGQLGTGGGVPVQAGAMRGRYYDFSRRSGDENNASRLWPQNRKMDTTRVECIGATILGLASRHVGFRRVWDFLARRKPLNVVEFFELAEQSGLSLDDRHDIQHSYYQEGLTWSVRGRVVARTNDPKKPTKPVKGAQVRILSRAGR